MAINLLLFSVLTIATVAAARPLQERLLAGMTELRDLLIREGERKLGLSIEYRSLGPSVFGHLDLRGLSVFGGEDPAYARERPLLSLDRARISFSPFALLAGDVPGSVRSVRLDGPVLALGPGGNRELRVLAEGLKGGGSPSFPVGRKRPLRVSIRRGGCSFRYGAVSAGFRGLNFDASLGPEGIAARGKWSTTLSFDYLRGKNLTVGMAGRLLGDYDPRSGRGTVTLNIPAVEGEGFTVSAVNFHVALDEGGLRISKIPDRIPYGLRVDWVYGTGRVSGEFRAEDFFPRELLFLSGPLRRYDRHLAMRVNGEASFDSQGSASSGLAYRADMDGAVGPYGPLGRVDWRVRGTGTGEGVSLEEFALRFARGELRYAGDLGFLPFAPNGTLSVRDFSLSGDGAAGGDLSFASGDNRIRFFSGNLSLGNASFAAVDGEVVLSPSRGGDTFLNLSLLRFREAASWEDAALGGIRLRGSYSPSPRELQAQLGLDSFSAGDLLEMLRPFAAAPLPSALPAGAARLLISTEAFLATDFSQVSYNAPQIVAAWKGPSGLAPGASGEVLALASVSGTNRRFELSRGSVVWGDAGLELQGIVDMEDPDDVFFSFQAAWQDLVYFFQGTMLDRRVLSLSGSYDFSGNLVLGAGGLVSGILTAGPLPLPAGGQYAMLSLGLSFHYQRKDRWNVVLDFLDLSGLPSRTANVRLRGEADQDGGFLGEIALDDGRNPLSGQAAFFREEGGDWSGNGRLESRDGQERYRADFLLQGGAFELTLNGERMQIGRFLGTGLSPVAEGSARLTWDLADRWGLAFTVNSLALRLGERDLHLNGRGTLDGGSLVLESVRFGSGGLSGELPRLELDRAGAALLTAGSLRGSALGKDLSALFRVEAEFAPLPSWLDLGSALGSLRLGLEVDRLSYDGREAEPFGLLLLRSGGALELSGGPGDMLRLSLDGEGSFYASLASPSPLRGSFTGFVSSGTIDVASSNLYADLGGLFSLIPPNPAVNGTGGIATGRLRIRGPLGDPEFYGAVYGTGVTLEVPAYLGAEIGPTPITVIIEGNEMSFGPQYAAVGGGAAVVDAWFRFERWIPDTFRIDIRAGPESPVPFALDIAGVVAHGGASGTIVISMENRELRVLGDLTGDDAEIILAAEEMAAQERRFEDMPPPLAPFFVDISVTSGRKVDFYWPNSTLPILRANAAAGTGFRVVTDSLSGRFSMTGDVVLKSGEIFYVNRSFYIRDGILRFREDENSFDPRITARAELRDRSDEGPVTISMIVENEPLRRFTARFESTPPLSQADIFIILGQSFSNPEGTVAGEASPSALRGTILSTVDTAAQFMIVRRLEQAVRNSLGLDMFSLRTSLIRNIVSSLWTPVDSNRLLGNYLDNTTVFVGKYIGTDMFIQGMLSLRYDDPADSRQGVRIPGRGLSLGQVSLEPDIGIELSSPLFDIRWNIAPYHLENLFIDDVSFTLLWRWTIR